MEGLTNVHAALNLAAQETQKVDPEIVVLSFKLRDDVKKDVGEICQRHGTTVAEFLRQCCISLVKDYKR